MKYIVGVDEVGRGPLAGPVAVCAFAILESNHKKIKENFSDARDSKKLTSQKREEIFERVNKLKKIYNIRYIVYYKSNIFIDRYGINDAIDFCIKKSFDRLNLNPKKTKIFLDGGLKAPNQFKYQKTIIKGDDKVSVISLASIVAKVMRDNLMKKLAEKYPGYGFETHKGYGTKNHKQAINNKGLSYIHRKSFIHFF